MKKIITLCMCFFLLTAHIPAFAQNQLSTEWDLSEIFESDDHYREAVATLRNDYTPQIRSLQGQLHQEEKLLELFQLMEKSSIKLGHAYAYATMNSHLDTTSSTYQQMTQEMLAVMSEFQEASSYITNELLKRTDDELIQLADSPLFEAYSDQLYQVIATRESALTDEEEKLLALMTPLAGSPEAIYTQITTSDESNVLFVDHYDREVPFNIEHHQIYLFLDESLWRERVFEAFYQPYIQRFNSLSATYIAEVNKNLLMMEARGSDSVLEYALGGQLDPEVYENFIHTARANRHVLQNAMTLRKKALGVEKLKTSDLHLAYTTEVLEYNSYDFETAAKITQEATAIFGNDYTQRLESYLNGSYIDLYPKPNKYQGAYSWGVYGKTPYILMNYNGSFSDMQTLAHEIGHSMNSLYIKDQQPMENAGIPNFPGEMPAILNEILVLNTLAQQTTKPEEKLGYRTQELNFMIQTFFDQAILADFEWQVYQKAESGESLTGEMLNELWMNTLAYYYEDTLEIEPFYAYHWLMIPHFYSTYYVYAYPMSMVAAYALAEKFEQDPDQTQVNYLEYLSLGTSLSALESLEILGIDLKDESTFDAFFNHKQECIDDIHHMLFEEPFKISYPTTLLTMEQANLYMRRMGISPDRQNSLEAYEDDQIYTTILLTASLFAILTLILAAYCVHLKKKAKQQKELIQFLKSQQTE